MRRIVLLSVMTLPILLTSWSVPQSKVSQEVIQLTALDGAQFYAAYSFPLGSSPKAAILSTHPRGSLGVYFMLTPLIERGFGGLGLTTRDPNRSSIHELNLLEIAAGINFLKSRGVEHVILLGHSGGGSLMAYYQAQAETAPPNRVNQTPAGDPPDLNKFELPKADGLITSSAQEGEGLHVADRLDPSLTDESDPYSYDPSLDMYNPANGFRLPPEETRYSQEFVQRFRRAQQQRAQRLVDIAKSHIREQNFYRDLMKSPAYQKMDLMERLTIERRANFERPMIIYRVYSDPAYVDLSMDPSDRMWGYMGAPVKDGWRRCDLLNWTFDIPRLGAISPRRFLSTESIVSNARLHDNLRKISIPVLILNGSADGMGIRPSGAKATFEAATSKDKERVWIIGAGHMMTPEGTKAGKGDQTEQYYNAITNWLNKRWTK